MKKNYDVVVVGGGASGLFACQQIVGRSNLSVCILEANERVGKKLVATGNGKCNLSNLDMNYIHYNKPRFVENFLMRFGAIETIAEFEKIGLLTKVVDKRVYPYSETASVVLDVLRKKIENKADVLTSHTVSSIKSVNGTYQILGVQKDENKKESPFLIEAKVVVLAVGSPAQFGKNSLFLAENLGHSFENFKPSLVPIRTNKDGVKGLSGVRVKAGVRLGYRSEIGEVLFKDFGVSGIAVFNMSSEIARGNANGDKLIIDFMPEMSLAEIEMILQKKHAKTAYEMLFGIFHTKVIDRILWYAGVAPEDEGKQNIEKIANAIKNYTLKILGVGEMSTCQVACGGLKVQEFDDDLQSKYKKNFYAMGEALDVDGDCGGYNLQWAWTSAKIVSDSILKSNQKEVQDGTI